MSAEIIQFLPRSRPSLPSERLIAEARAQYQAIFPDVPPAEDTAPCETNPDNLA